MEVRREVVLEASPDEVWELLTDAEELSTWFGGDVVFDPHPGAAAVFTELDAVHYAVVHDVVPGERLAFQWWPDRDEGDESAASVVTFVLEAVPTGTKLTVTETVPAVAVAAWPGRVLDLEWRCVTRSLVRV
jgi:uncharacterized protein YndB with AHSA1/START domain